MNLLGSVNDRDELLSSGMKQRQAFMQKQEAVLNQQQAPLNHQDSEPRYNWANTMSDDLVTSPRRNDIDALVDESMYGSNSTGKRDSRVSRISRRDSRISQYIMNMVEPEKNIQVFSGPNEVQMDELKIKRIKCLGSGGQGQIHVVKIAQLDGQFVEKTCEPIIQNPQLADELMRQMLSEFLIAKDLQHQNINAYRYFMRKHDPRRKITELHIL